MAHDIDGGIMQHHVGGVGMFDHLPDFVVVMVCEYRDGDWFRLRGKIVAGFTRPRAERGRKADIRIYDERGIMIFQNNDNVTSTDALSLLDELTKGKTLFGETVDDTLHKFYAKRGRALVRLW